MSSPETPDDPSHLRSFLRRIVLPLGCIAAFVAMFYLIENIRGRNALEGTKAEWEALGESFDWSARIPKPIPDDDNMLMAPNLEDWFVRKSAAPKWDDLSSLLNAATAISTANPQVVGTVEFTEADPTSRPWSDFEKLSSMDELPANLFPAVSFLPTVASFKSTANDFNFIATHRPDQLPRVALRLSTTSELPPLDVTRRAFHRPYGPWILDLRATANPRRFELLIVKTTALSAADILSLTDTFQPNFDDILNGAQRSGVYRTGNYKEYNAQPIPSFTQPRALARCLAARAQAHLLLGNAPAATRDIDVQDANRKTLGPNLTLVKAMIDVVLADMQMTAIQDGFALGLGKDFDLLRLQERMARENFLVNTMDAMRNELAGHAAWMENMQTSFAASALSSMGSTPGNLNFLWHLIPQGWIKQNLHNLIRIQMPVIRSVNRTTGRLDITAYEEAVKLIDAEVKTSGPYHFYAALATPAFDRVIKQSAIRQTQAHLTTLACALERHRLDTGAYPDKLDSLVPKYLAKIPHQVVNEKPLLYRKETDGGCTIWSIGWDLKDDNGNPGTSPTLDDKSPDWAWKLPAPKP